MNWDDYFMAIAQTISLKSKDDVQVGTVLVSADNDLLTTGYNGIPRGVSEDDPTRMHHPYKGKYMEHSEANAVNNAARLGVSTKGSTAYVTWFPCAHCARTLIQAGIVRLVYGRYPDLEHERWGEHFEASMVMLQEAGVSLHFHNPHE